MNEKWMLNEINNTQRAEEEKQKNKIMYNIHPNSYGMVGNES